LHDKDLEAKKGKLKRTFSDKVAMQCCVSFGLLGFTVIIYYEVFPLWALTSQSLGGLDFDSYEIGIADAIAAIASVTFQLFLYPSVAKKFSLIQV
jgi:hypothetical protein